jgi:hypothetical protein
MMAMFASDKNIRTLTYYESPETTIRITRVYKPKARDRSQGFRMEVGKPNYTARQFIKKYIKTGEPFPVNRIQVKFYPKKKKK